MWGQSSWALLLLLVFIRLALVCCSESSYEYDRLAEIEKHCSLYLSSALELNPDSIREYNLEDELSFLNGEWEQELDGMAPLMPFDESDMFWDWFSYAAPLRSVSLEITKKDAGPVRGMQDAVVVGGELSIGIHRKGSLGFGSEYGVGFSKRPGFSLLVMEFKGVYVETKENDGERILCLLGNSKNSTTSYLSMLGTETEVESDDLVLLVLHYPRVFNLTIQAIIGKMVSLSPPGTGSYFDRVRITSQPGHCSRYQFNETVESRDPDPLKSQHRDESIEEDGPVYLSSREFCKNFRDTPLIRFSIEQQDYMNDSNSSIRKIGPFLLGKERKDTMNWQHEEFNLAMKPIKCEDESGKVSAVMRIIPESMDQETAASRMGISGATMTAEGMWDPSNRQLYMVGCIGGTQPDLGNRCNSRVVLHFPKTFSLDQRSVIMGSISCIGDRNDSFSPLGISLTVRPLDLINYYWYPTPCEYNYSEIKLAQEFWGRTRPSQPFSFISSIKKAFVRYPSFEDQRHGGEQPFSQLSHLSEKLRFHTRSFPIQFNKYDKTMYFLQGELFSVGPLCGQYGPRHYNYSLADDAATHGSSQVLNVSVHLTYTVDDRVFTGRVEKSVTYLFLEGVYDTYSGEMHLVGCGNIKVGRSFSFVEPYLDCSMAVRIQYSPENTRWLKNPSVEITIMSRGNVSDPLYFQPFILRKISVYSPNHQQDVVFRVILEGSLRVLLLVLDIGAISGQFLYMKKHPEVVPGISLVMLGTQILGYLFPLISGSDILIKPKESNMYAETQPYGDHGQYRLLIGILDGSTKILLLIVLLLIMRLFRVTARSRTSSNFCDDWKVLSITSAIHLLGFALMFASPEVRLGAGYYFPFPWKKLVVAYFNIVETFFMIPQIIMSYLSKNSGIPPVRRAYLMAFILSRWFLSSYDGIRDPILDPDSRDDWGFGFEPDAVLASGQISFSMIIIFLATMMLIGDRCSKHELGKLFRSKVSRFLPFVSDRSAMKSAEASSAAAMEESSAE